MSQTITIKCTSRVSTKVKETFYTVEWCEERSIAETDDIEAERAALWETCNNEVDNQIKDILS